MDNSQNGYSSVGKTGEIKKNKNEWNSFQDRENQDPEKRKSFGRKKIWKKGKVSEGRCGILGKSEKI